MLCLGKKYHIIFYLMHTLPILLPQSNFKQIDSVFSQYIQATTKLCMAYQVLTRPKGLIYQTFQNTVGQFTVFKQFNGIIGQPTSCMCLSRNPWLEFPWVIFTDILNSQLCLCHTLALKLKHPLNLGQYYKSYAL